MTAPQCEQTWQCPDKCCPPQRCTADAVWRLSYPCERPGCDCSATVQLLCARCADHPVIVGQAPTRRPL